MRKMNLNQFAKVKIALAITLVLALSFHIFTNPNITGFVSLDFIMEDLNITLTESQSFILTSTATEPFTLTSFKISGDIMGNGSVEVYLDNNQGQKLMIYKNIRTRGGGMEQITGRATTEEQAEVSAEKKSYLIISPDKIIENVEPLQLSEKEETVSGPFSNECVETCFIRMELSSDTIYNLIFITEPGTILKFNKIFYTIEVE